MGFGKPRETRRGQDEQNKAHREHHDGGPHSTCTRRLIGGIACWCRRSLGQFPIDALQVHAQRMHTRITVLWAFGHHLAKDVLQAVGDLGDAFAQVGYRFLLVGDLHQDQVASRVNILAREQGM